VDNDGTNTMIVRSLYVAAFEIFYVSVSVLLNFMDHSCQYDSSRLLTNNDLNSFPYFFFCFFLQLLI